jgi:hypothetical protein
MGVGACPKMSLLCHRPAAELPPSLRHQKDTVRAGSLSTQGSSKFGCRWGRPWQSLFHLGPVFSSLQEGRRSLGCVQPCRGCGHSDCALSSPAWEMLSELPVSQFCLPPPWTRQADEKF